MAHQNFNVSKIEKYTTKEGLNDVWRKLINSAISATDTSYSPYSKFKVGAALILENNDIILGSNQENASYPLCMCAERVALYSANVQANNMRIIAIAVTAKAELENRTQVLSPCGACRQVLFEKEILQKSNLPILCGFPNGPFTIFPSIKALLPDGFGPDFLLT